MRDYPIRTDCAYERSKVIVAEKYAKQYGLDVVRGGKHGKGWNDKLHYWLDFRPTACSITDNH